MTAGKSIASRASMRQEDEASVPVTNMRSRAIRVSCQTQMTVVEALKSSTDERDSSVSWSTRVSGIATRGSKCYLRVGHHHTHRMARPRVCVGDNALLSQKIHYYHSTGDACDHRVNITTCTTQLTQTLDTAQSWRSDASSFLGGVSPSGETSRPQPHNATTTTTQRLSR